MTTTNKTWGELKQDLFVMDCQHYWVIATAQGPTSEGVCQNCGECRDFKNHVSLGFDSDSEANLVMAKSSAKGRELRRQQQLGESQDAG